MAKRTAGQTALLQAVRVQNNKEIWSLIEQADIDDLEWFDQMLELQLEETPHWVKDEEALHDIQAWHRRVRTTVREVLHNKRVASRKRAGMLKYAREASLVALGALIGWALAWYFPSPV